MSELQSLLDWEHVMQGGDDNSRGVKLRRLGEAVNQCLADAVTHVAPRLRTDFKRGYSRWRDNEHYRRETEHHVPLFDAVTASVHQALGVSAHTVFQARCLVKKKY